MSKYQVVLIFILIVALLLKLPSPTLSQKTSSITADPSDINVTVKLNSKNRTKATTEITIKNTMPENKTIIFQGDLSGNFPKFDLYNQSLTVPANSIKSHLVIVDVGDLNTSLYNISLNFFLKDDFEKKPIGQVTFHIRIVSGYTVGWPLIADPNFFNLTVPATKFTVREVNLTNIADETVVGELIGLNAPCINSPGITILGDHKINLRKNEKTTIKVRINGAETGSSTCYSMVINLLWDKTNFSEEHSIVMFNVKTSPGPLTILGIFLNDPLAIPLTILSFVVAATVIVLLLRRWNKRKLHP